tara:strand:- start:441 stop:680 length:240 start_codon:yes stop_codon:yes gene_type:complete
MKYFFAFIFTIVFSAIINSQIVLAENINNSNKLENPTSEKIEGSLNKDKKLVRINSEEDIFGDEQTFPFVAGLGKNAAH